MLSHWRCWTPTQRGGVYQVPSFFHPLIHSRHLNHIWQTDRPIMGERIFDSHAPYLVIRSPCWNYCQCWECTFPRAVRVNVDLMSEINSCMFVFLWRYLSLLASVMHYTTLGLILELLYSCATWRKLRS